MTFVVNVAAALIAYMWQPKKPAINWSARDAQALVCDSYPKLRLSTNPFTRTQVQLLATQANLTYVVFHAHHGI